MATVFTLANKKGGVGKTTLATNLSMLCAARTKARVLLIDADPQGSGLDWCDARPDSPPIKVIGYPRATVHREVERIRDEWDYIFLDSPAGARDDKAQDITRGTILAADLVLIPVQPSPLDVWGSRDIVALAADAQVFKPDQRAVFVINQQIPRSVIARDVKAAIKQFPIDALDSTIAHRVAFAEAAATGHAVFEREPFSLAAQEVAALWSEIQRVMA